MSIVCCCHDSAARLGPTLAALAAQEGTDGIDWEVVLVDNASKDGTSELARTLWPAGAPAPLRVVEEPALGLSHARARGMATARFDLICFIDDDNRVRSDWVRRVNAVMRDHPEVGACCGSNLATFDGSAPPWFEAFQYLYAVGRLGEAGGDVTDSHGMLRGAGLTLRRAAWDDLVGRGFRSRLSDRKGNQLSSGGDSELSLALRWAGWRLWCDHGLTLEHHMPEGRLAWSYLVRLVRGSGASTPALDPYYPEFRRTGGLRDRLRRTWYYQAARSIRSLARHPLRACWPARFLAEGDALVTTVEAQRGRLMQLLALRGDYDRQFADAFEPHLGEFPRRASPDASTQPPATSENSASSRSR